MTVLPVMVKALPLVSGVPEPVIVKVLLVISKVVEAAMFSDVRVTFVEADTLVEAVAVATAPKSVPAVLSVIDWAPPWPKVTVPAPLV